MVTQPARRNGWLYRAPPWRAPRIRRHHHHHVDLIGGFFALMGLFLFTMFFLEVWFLEAFLWLAVWYYYGMFLGVRWLVRRFWRHNPIGQIIDSHAARRDRNRRAPYDPHGAPQRPIDLGALGTQRQGYDRD